ncbi:MAG: helical backbone metal receptor [Victivallaceae bacterium]|nr:helical backbone metal receptor [Victivallaceae bacterium]
MMGFLGKAVRPAAAFALLFFSMNIRAAEASKSAHRVISLSPALTELVFHLGKGGLLVGRSSVCNYPPEAASIPVAGDYADPNVERCIALRPDRIITNDLINPQVGKTFEQAKIDFSLLKCANIDDYRACVVEIGRILDAEAEAKREVERIDGALRRFRNQPPLKKKVLYVVWDSPLMVAGPGSLPDEVLRLAGAENVASDKRIPRYFKCSFDWLLTRKIDAIVWTAPPRDLEKSLLWKHLEAVRRNHVIRGIHNDLVHRPGPRIFDGIEQLRKALERL